jgi:nucleotide-binding universal stress UspA family protein
MKNILVPTETHDVMASVLETAALVQRRFGGYLEGFALRPAVPDYVPIDMVSGLAWHVDEKADEETRRSAFAMFEGFMKERGVPETPSGSSDPGYGWHAKAPAGDMFLASHARVFDLVVLGRPMSGKAQPSMASLEAVLFESGRPLLMAPPMPPKSLGETVVIAWNGSTETARTVAMATPFLREAKRIVVLMIEGWSVPGPSGDQLAASLRRCGLTVETVMSPRDRRNDGETILARAQVLGADLLVKGAYTQSRLRQMIFGGATAHILAHASIPVLMAN